MTKTSPNDQEMTDVFSRFSAPLPPLPQPADDKIKISDRKKAALVTAAVLLGGGAAFAAVNYDSILAGLGGDGATLPPVPVESPSAFDSPEDTVDKADPAPLEHNKMSAVQSGTITPNENIEIAANVEPGMTFGQAYATAREEVGMGGIFSWRGEVYNTFTVEEWQGLSLGQRREFLANVGYETPGSSSSESTPDIYEFVINGRTALGVDDNHDGVADAIIFLDEETNDLIAYLNMEGDDRLDSVYRYDFGAEQIVGMQTLEEPFLVDVHKLEAVANAAYEPVGTDLSFATNDDKTFDNAHPDDYADDSGYVNNAEIPEMD